MKKISLLVSVLTFLSFCFTSCEKSSGDVLKGTWKYVPGYNSSTMAGLEQPEMTYIFDGKGNYTFISKYYGEEKMLKGTYVIEKEAIVRTYYTKQDIDGSKEYSEVLELDANSTPPTLTGYAYDSDGNLLMTLLFEKK